MKKTISCVLFDLDGTLIDTAPDLVACLNKTLIEYDFPPVSFDFVKPNGSFGAVAMIDASIDKNVDEATRERMLDAMLTLYENNIATHSDFFDGMREVLAFIESHPIPWGIVTNKRTRFTVPLIHAFDLSSRAACVISGDSTPTPKPHPAPLFAACEQAGVIASECVYIGDAAHDIVAGNAANMRTLAAVYGYLQPNDQPENWGAEALIHSPAQLLTWLKNVL
jgi:phosphoglycolate phosphatase